MVRSIVHPPIGSIGEPETTVDQSKKLRFSHDLISSDLPNGILKISVNRRFHGVFLGFSTDPFPRSKLRAIYK